MILDFVVDAKACLADLTDVQTNQIPFAMKNALNETALQFQRVQIGHIHQTFTLRRATWIDQSVKITHFATKTQQWATIGIHPPGGDARSDILGKFEDETQKSSTTPGGFVAIPIDAKRTRTGLIRGAKRDRKTGQLAADGGKSRRPREYNFIQVGNRILGEARTFIVKRLDNGGELILQRTRAGVVALYSLVRVAKITPDLDFEVNAEAVVETAWPINLANALEQAMSTLK